MTDDIATLKPWTVKAIDPRVSDAIVAAARREGINAGQLIERLWAAWLAQGSPTQVAVVAAQPPVNAPAPPVNAPDLATLLHAAGPFGADNPMPREARSLINDLARSARSAQSPRVVSPRHTNG